jgi:hypothetical protein
MSETEKIVSYDRAFASAHETERFGDVSLPLAATGGVLLMAAILLMLFALSNAHRPFAIPAFFLRDRRRLRATKATIVGQNPRLAVLGPRHSTTRRARRPAQRSGQSSRAPPRRTI